MIALTLFALVAFASAADEKTCLVGEWSEWSGCTSSRHCPAVPHPLTTYPIPATSARDSGNEAMQVLKQAKLKSWAEIDLCKRMGTCPEHLFKPMSGPFKCEGGLAGDIPCNNIDQLSFLTFAELGYGNPLPGDSPRGNDVWGWVDPQNGDEYAMMGLTGGTAFVRVTNPEEPVPVGFIYSATVASSWRDIKVIGNYAYIVSEARDHGLQVFDLTRLRGRTSVEYFTPDAVNKDFGQAHNIVANPDTDFIFVVGSTASGYPRTCRGGLQIFDVSDPLNPTFVSCFGDDGYVHDAQCVIYHGPDTRYQGREICACFNEDSLTIVDVEDKQNMRMIAKTGYINVAYTHQGWLTEDHEIILLDDELDEQSSSSSQNTKTYVWDVRDLTDPKLRSVFESTELSIDHNQYIIGDLTYQANYESGLRILRLNRQTEVLSQVAFFDVYPVRTTANFNGAWSVYPYFPSGNIAISSINHGLFMVRPDRLAIAAMTDDYSQSTRVREVVGAEEGATCPPLVETKVCQVPVIC